MFLSFPRQTFLLFFDMPATNSNTMSHPAPCMLCVCVAVCGDCVCCSHLQSMSSCVTKPALHAPPCPWQRPRAGSEGHCSPAAPTSTPTSTSTSTTKRQLSLSLPRHAVSGPRCQRCQPNTGSWSQGQSQT